MENGKYKTRYTREKWDFYYDLYVDYLENHDGKYPKRGERYKNHDMSDWIVDNRKIYCNGILTSNGDMIHRGEILYKEQIEKLILCKFVFAAHDNTWNKNYEALKDYVQKNNGIFPVSGVIHNGVNLGTWVIKQRQIKDKLSKERIAKLDEINFPWVAYDDLWNQNYNEFTKYLEEHNGVYPTEKDNKVLYNWLTRQRTIYNKGEKQKDGSIVYTTKNSKGLISKETLTIERLEKLYKINFVFNNALNAWLTNYNLVVECIKEYQKLPKTETIYKNTNIGLWFNRMRNVYNNGIKNEDGSLTYLSTTINSDQVLLLDKIREYLQDSFTYRANLCVEYMLDNHRAPRHNMIYKGDNIYAFYSYNISALHNGTIDEDGNLHYNNRVTPKEHVELIKRIDRVLKIYCDKTPFEKNYRLLKEFINEYGRMPEKGEEYKGVKLINYVNKLRNIYINGTFDENGNLIYKNEKITKEQIKMLDNINFEWFSSQRAMDKKEINDNNQYQIKRELLKKMKLVLEQAKDSNEVKEKFNSVIRGR